MDLDDVPTPTQAGFQAQVEDIATGALATAIGHTLNPQPWSLV
jgi:hypothetical protein